MMPLCEDQGVGVIPWSPLARGRLARPLGETTVRSETDGVGKVLYKDDDAADGAIITALAEIAVAKGAKMASLGLAWHFTKGVAAPIIGASKAHHIDDAVAALDIELTAQEIASLEGPYRPKWPTGLAMPMAPMDQVTVKQG